MGTISSVEDIANAVVYLTEAGQITGEVLHWTAVRTLANGNQRKLSSTSAERRLKELGISFRRPPNRSGPMWKRCKLAICFFLTGMLPTEGREANSSVTWGRSWI